jgi:hypothetical protein
MEKYEKEMQEYELKMKIYKEYLEPEIYYSMYQDAINRIENLLHEDSYSKKLDLIKNEKTKYLNQYHIFDKLVFLLENHFQVQRVKKKIVIKSEKTYQRGFALNNLLSQFQHILRIAPRNRFEFRFSQNDLLSNFNK